MHYDKTYAQPLPFDRQPGMNYEQAVLLDKEVGASVHSAFLHTFDPSAVFSTHGPSEPIIP